MNMPSEPVLPQAPVKSGGAAARSFGRAANWTVGIVAGILVAISIGGYFYHRGHLAAIAGEHLRLIVTGPSSLQAGVGAEYTVSTTAINGQPLPSQVEVALLGPDGRRIKTYQETTDEHGRLQVAIPADVSLPSQVKLKIAAWRQGNREEMETNLPVEPVRYVARLSSDRPLYRPGETIYYRALCLSRLGLTEAGPMPVRFEILNPSGAIVPNSRLDGVTDHGVGSGAYAIPNDLPEGQYTLVVQSPERAFSEQRHSFFVRPYELSHANKELDSSDEAKTTPAEVDKVEVSFHAEGGDLAAGLENRVYFRARDSAGKPVDIAGVIVAEGRDADDSGQPGRDAEVAAAETTYEGMGVFSLVPQAGETYHLKITPPTGVKDEPKLPEVSTEREVVLSTGSGVFAAGAPLEFNVRAAKANLPLVVAAYCRGVQVGQQPLVTKTTGSGGNPVAVAVDDAADGVIRLTVYDYSTAPPKPVAERLVYRRPARRLSVQAVGLKDRYAPGEKVDVSLLVTNEKGEPTPATLSVAVIDEALLKLADNAMPAMPTYFLLSSQIAPREGDSPKNGPVPEQAEFYLSDETKDNVPAAVALDLLLGTSQRRQSDEKSPAEAKAGQTDASGPPAMFDNLGKIRADYEKSLADYQADRTNTLNILVTGSFLGGLGLVLLVAMLGLLRIVSGMHLWIPAIGSTTCCLIIGAILMDPGRFAPAQGAAVEFQSYHAAMPTAGESKAAAPLPEKSEKKQADPLVVRQYAHRRVAEMLYWNPMRIAGPDGRASISFELSDAATTFRVMVDASGDGRIGSGRAEITSGAAASGETKTPETSAEASPSRGN